VDAAIGQTQNDFPQVNEVPGKTVHRVTQYRVALANKAEHSFELRPFCILARGFVGESFVPPDAFELPDLVLIEATDAHVPNTLPFSPACALAPTELSE
jgi:hypothetical protein